MKKIFVLAFVIISLSARSQDSTKITVPIQARDVYYISAGIFNDYSLGELFDSIKVKVRVGNPPNGTNVIQLTGYTMDWFDVLVQLRNNAHALKLNHAQRVDVLLRAVNQPFLSAKIDSLDSRDINHDANIIQRGKDKSQRKINAQ